MERFWSKVDTTPGFGPNGDCWRWNAAKDKEGYGLFWMDGRAQRAHRVAWQLESGEVMEAQDACHTCDTPSCVNPAHVFPGSRSDNMKDASQKGRIVIPRDSSGWRSQYADATHCIRSHPFDEANTLWYQGRRYCRACKRDRNREARKRARVCLSMEAPAAIEAA